MAGARRDQGVEQLGPEVAGAGRRWRFAEHQGVEPGVEHYEDLLLRVAAQIERAAPWADRRPRVHA